MNNEMIVEAIILKSCSCKSCANQFTKYTPEQIDLQRKINNCTLIAVREALPNCLVLIGSYDAHHTDSLEIIRKIVDKRCKGGYRFAQSVWLDPLSFAVGNVDMIVDKINKRLKRT